MLFLLEPVPDIFQGPLGNQRIPHLFVADYGSQLSVLARYGIKSYAVEGRDYRFANDDPTDLRYENIIVLNRYRGVRQFAEKGFLK